MDALKKVGPLAHKHNELAYLLQLDLLLSGLLTFLSKPWKFPGFKPSTKCTWSLPSPGSHQRLDPTVASVAWRKRSCEVCGNRSTMEKPGNQKRSAHLGEPEPAFWANPFSFVFFFWYNRVLLQVTYYQQLQCACATDVHPAGSVGCH